MAEQQQQRFFDIEKSVCLLQNSKRKHGANFYDTPEILVSFDVDDTNLKIFYVPINLEEEACAIAAATLDSQILERIGGEEDLVVLRERTENITQCYGLQEAQRLSSSPTGRHLFIGRHYSEGASALYADLESETIDEEISEHNGTIDLFAYLAQGKCLVLRERGNKLTLETLCLESEEEEGEDSIELKPVDTSMRDPYSRCEFLGANKDKTKFAVHFIRIGERDTITVFDIRGNVLRSLELSDNRFCEWDDLGRPFRGRFDESFSTLVDLRNLTIYTGLFDGKQRHTHLYTI